MLIIHRVMTNREGTEPLMQMHGNLEPFLRVLAGCAIGAFVLLGELVYGYSYLLA